MISLFRVFGRREIVGWGDCEGSVRCGEAGISMVYGGLKIS